MNVAKLRRRFQSAIVCRVSTTPKTQLTRSITLRKFGSPHWISTDGVIVTHTGAISKKGNAKEYWLLSSTEYVFSWQHKEEARREDSLFSRELSRVTRFDLAVKSVDIISVADG